MAKRLEIQNLMGDLHTTFNYPLDGFEKMLGAGVLKTTSVVICVEMGSK